MNLVEDVWKTPLCDQKYIHDCNDKEYYYYKWGHKSALHFMALHVAPEAQARIEELEQVLQEFLDRSASLREEYSDMDGVAKRAEEVLNK